MENRKGVLIAIIVLLVIFVPLTILGFITHLSNGNKEENPNHEFVYKGHLWFYDNTDKLLGNYECLTESCGLSKGIIDDDEYGIVYYKDGNKESIDYEGSDYTILTDGTDNFIYNIKDQKKFLEIEGIKNYNMVLNDNLYIVKNNGKWGVVKINNTGNNDLIMMIPFEYDFIGLTNKLNENNTLSTDAFIVKKDDKWLLINTTKEELTTGIDTPIIDYTDKLLFSKDNNNYQVYNYNGTRLYDDYTIVKYTNQDNYVGFISNNVLYVYNENTIIGRYAVDNADSEIELAINNNTLDVKYAEKVLGNIAIS